MCNTVQEKELSNKTVGHFQCHIDDVLSNFFKTGPKQHFDTESLGKRESFVSRHQTVQVQSAR